MTIEDAESWLALELSGINETNEGESPRKKCRRDSKSTELNFSAIPEDYFNSFKGEDGSIGNIEKDVINKETKDDTIKLLANRKVTELENKNFNIIKDVQV
ncbi:hypothetical protein O181_074831 [Austropuccinia psidii MF-1]|uniref:Uncharacterized protein n=1 Tax=Austropuccinia psidii MF-1 TaxID=1389203 RepID=A0A9Q3FDK1_9BASI|nr:hypothetical protein [Austropuccinia psidii MF-1]